MQGKIMSTTQKYRAEYNLWIKTASGCNKPLTTSYESYVVSLYRRKKPPRVLPGHISPTKKNMATANRVDYKAWYAAAHICPVCGKPMHHSYRAYAMAIKKTGKPPKHHPECASRRTREIKLNGCVLREAQGRCEKALSCPRYESCLNAADAAGWRGWRTAQK